MLFNSFLATTYTLCKYNLMWILMKMGNFYNLIFACLNFVILCSLFLSWLLDVIKHISWEFLSNKGIQLTNILSCFQLYCSLIYSFLFFFQQHLSLPLVGHNAVVSGNAETMCSLEATAASRQNCYAGMTLTTSEL